MSVSTITLAPHSTRHLPLDLNRIRPFYNLLGNRIDLCDRLVAEDVATQMARAMRAVDRSSNVSYEMDDLHRGATAVGESVDSIKDAVGSRETVVGDLADQIAERQAEASDLFHQRLNNLNTLIRQTHATTEQVRMHQVLDVVDKLLQQQDLDAPEDIKRYIGELNFVSYFGHYDIESADPDRADSRAYHGVCPVMSGTLDAIEHSALQFHERGNAYDDMSVEGYRVYLLETGDALPEGAHVRRWMGAFWVAISKESDFRLSNVTVDRLQYFVEKTRLYQLYTPTRSENAHIVRETLSAQRLFELESKIKNDPNYARYDANTHIEDALDNPPAPNGRAG